MSVNMKLKKPDDDQYSPEEAKQRMMAALRGARAAGHVPMKAKKAAKKTSLKKTPAGEPASSVTFAGSFAR
jgi:hypothetical protein